MQTMTAAYARDHVREILDNAIAGKPVVLTRNGKTLAIVMPTEFLPMAFLTGADLPADVKTG